VGAADCPQPIDSITTAAAHIEPLLKRRVHRLWPRHPAVSKDATSSSSSLLFLG
jgi:hypothetical protein